MWRHWVYEPYHERYIYTLFTPPYHLLHFKHPVSNDLPHFYPDCCQNRNIYY